MGAWQLKDKSWIKFGHKSSNLKGLPKAALNTGMITAKKTVSQFGHNMDKFKWGFIDTKPTISSSYNQVISKQYPKYTGPKAPYVNPRGGGQPGVNVRVQGHPMKAAGKFSTIPEGYLANLSNQKALAARTAKVAKNVGKIAKVGRIATPVGAAMAAYDVTKWAAQWHKDNPDYKKQKYNKYGTKDY